MMSAILAHGWNGRIDILTDGVATHNKDGRVARIRSKQHRLANGILVAGVGLPSLIAVFADIIGSLAKGGLDDTVALAPIAWERIRARAPRERWQRPCSVVLAGHSAGRPMMHIVHENEDGGFDFWLDEAGYIGIPGGDPSIHEPFIARFSAAPGAFDARRDGVELFEALRRRSLRDTEAGPRHAIGGFIEHASVTAAGIETAVIHRWHDVVGEVIDPDRKVGRVNSARRNKKPRPRRTTGSVVSATR